MITEKAKTQQTGMRLPADLYERARIAAFERRMTISAITAEALRRYLDASDRRKRPAA